MAEIYLFSSVYKTLHFPAKSVSNFDLRTPKKWFFNFLDIFKKSKLRKYTELEVLIVTPT